MRDDIEEVPEFFIFGFLVGEGFSRCEDVVDVICAEEGSEFYHGGFSGGGFVGGG